MKFRILASLAVIVLLAGLYFLTTAEPSSPTVQRPTAPSASSDEEKAIKGLKIN